MGWCEMYFFIKRTADIVFSALALLVLSAPMLLIAAIVKCTSKGSVFFWQKRIGKNKISFKMPKFRSMYTEAPSDMPTHLLQDPSRWITPIGSFLRKSSLDELPQLWCILIGEMSIVGPRPALWNQDDLIAERDKYGANNIRPGLTGWAQINGRDELPIEVKAKLDGEYVEKMSVWFDIKCIMLTALKVIKRDGIVEGGTGSIAVNTDKEAEKEPVIK